MTTKRQRRLEKERKAADFLEKHHGPLAELMQKVVGELGGELDIPRAEADARIAAEMAHRLDNAIEIPNALLEAADWFIFFLASLGCIGLVRTLERSAARRKDRVGRLEARLQNQGPKMAAAAKRRLEPRIARLQSRQ